MYRRRSGRTIAGIAGGLADHLNVDVLWVRLAFAALAAAGGVGVIVYGLLWAFVPQQDPEADVTPITNKERQQAIGLIALGVGVAIAGGSLTGTFNGWAGAALALAVVGAAVVWREADERRKGERGGFVRTLSGIGLVVSGVVAFLLQAVGNYDQPQFIIATVLAVLLGVAAVTVPWWLRVVRDLGDERRKRIRTEERAEIAAHLHDSVLQTLALIQKQAETPREVLRLARGQERQLRTWLYGPSGYSRGDVSNEPTLLSAAVEAACGEVEDTFAIKVQQVVVGDCELDEKLTALVQATREATVNAAKHAGVAEVSVYAEVEPDRVNIFVRDRGKGFDETTVPTDRHGLADSIRGRMDRNGGTVRIRTALGEGTEVHLEMTRSATSARNAGREAKA
ncbi:PspC domain-containing protein [Kibdelosporangium philippinense]|uniref:PspC domain-containing protein n=1 Tax=Kibdelosporangium philippinense TaxID=211113 RepID=A0ABS8ZEV9_9PSEU|nr:ATP-binding protein [Kibdelosporangium philippinense]MCE7005992.1 PspC domain-containing protein [Kibdelosporangium philippinense]